MPAPGKFESGRVYAGKDDKRRMIISDDGSNVVWRTLIVDKETTTPRSDFVKWFEAGGSDIALRRQGDPYPLSRKGKRVMLDGRKIEAPDEETAKWLAEVINRDPRVKLIGDDEPQARGRSGS